MSSLARVPRLALIPHFKTRILASALNVGLSFWTLVLFENLELSSRAPVALLVFMGSVGGAYCLASFPSAALEVG